MRQDQSECNNTHQTMKKKNGGRSNKPVSGVKRDGMTDDKLSLLTRLKVNNDNNKQEEVDMQ